jgi:hypothetical protein
MAGSRTKVLLEAGKSKVFAVALDWPGWARAGKKTPAAALEELAAYAPRYAEVAKLAEVALPGNLTYSVVEEVAGSVGTDFGIPNEVAAADRRRWTGAEAKRQIAIMTAAWDYLDQVGAAATPVLAKGPRGGGRDRDPVLQHVLAAETSYGRTLGLKIKEPALGDHDAIAAMRAAIVGVLSKPSSGGPIGKATGWPARYAVRRIVWHVLDHAWEIQDKSG